METWIPTHMNFYAICLLFVVPYVLLFHKSVFPAVPQIPRPGTLLRPLLTILVLLHTLWTLKLLLSPPVNLFRLLNLPLTAPVSAIRVALLEHQREQFPVGFLNKIAPDVEVLLTRLTSFEARVIYMKYGPYPLSQCAPCVHLSDFALFALAPSILPYLRAIILVSLVTSRATSRHAWRTPSLITLTAAFFTEVWWTIDGTVQFRDGKLDGWTHTHTYISRYIVLLLVPLFVHHLPEHSCPSALPPFFTYDPPLPTFPHQSSDFRLNNNSHDPKTPQHGNASSFGQSPSASTSAHPNSTMQDAQAPGRPSTPVSALTGTLTSLSTTISALRMLEWARIAGLRRSTLREKMSSYYATQDLDATHARSDGRLQREAERLGMGYTGEQAGSTVRRPRFGGRSSTWRGGDPRGLDRDSVMDDEDDDGRGDGRAPRQTEDDLEHSPLRAKARKAAQDLVRRFFTEGASGR